MSKPNFKLFEVAGEYIVAQTAEEAIQDHLNRIGQDWYKHDVLPEPEEVSLDTKGLFEQEKGYKEMTFREFLGDDFVYSGPQMICWHE